MVHYGFLINNTYLQFFPSQRRAAEIGSSPQKNAPKARPAVSRSWRTEAADRWNDKERCFFFLRVTHNIPTICIQILIMTYIAFVLLNKLVLYSYNLYSYKILLN